MSANPLLDVLADVRRKRWCTKLTCTTCGAHEYRRALDGVAGPDGEHLARAMAELDLAAWYDVEDVGGALGLAFASLRARRHVDHVLAAWLPRLQGHIRIADAVLFHVVRPGSTSTDLAHQWLEAAETMALETGDPSLLESLLYTQGGRIRANTILWERIQIARRGYAPLDRAAAKLGQRVP